VKVELKEVNKNNWYECTRLSVSEEQKKIFPVSVVYWMAMARYKTHLYELAVYNNNIIVGFCVYSLKSPDDGNPWIVSIMIDKKYQKRGFGREAVKEIINLIKSSCNCKKIMIGHRPENTLAGKLYESLGFNDSGQIVDGEVIRCLKFD